MVSERYLTNTGADARSMKASGLRTSVSQHIVKNGCLDVNDALQVEILRTYAPTMLSISDGGPSGTRDLQREGRPRGSVSVWLRPADVRFANVEAAAHGPRLPTTYASRLESGSRHGCGGNHM